jgi:site-specific recombinase XerD
VPPATSNEKLLASFTAYLKVEKGLARLSVSAYLSDLLQFAEFLEQHKRTLLLASG